MVHRLRLQTSFDAILAFEVPSPHSPLLPLIHAAMDGLGAERRFIMELGGPYLSTEVSGARLLLSIDYETTLEDALVLFDELLSAEDAPVHVGTGGFGGGGELDLLFLDANELRTLQDAFEIITGVGGLYGIWELVVAVRRAATRGSRKRQTSAAQEWVATGVLSRRLVSMVREQGHWETEELMQEFALDANHAGNLLRGCEFTYRPEARAWISESDHDGS